MTLCSIASASGSNSISDEQRDPVVAVSARGLCRFNTFARRTHPSRKAQDRGPVPISITVCEKSQPGGRALVASLAKKLVTKRDRKHGCEETGRNVSRK